MSVCERWEKREKPQLFDRSWKLKLKSAKMNSNLFFVHVSWKQKKIIIKLSFFFNHMKTINKSLKKIRQVNFNSDSDFSIPFRKIQHHRHSRFLLYTLTFTLGRNCNIKIHFTTLENGNGRVNRNKIYILATLGVWGAKELLYE